MLIKNLLQLILPIKKQSSSKTKGRSKQGCTFRQATCMNCNNDFLIKRGVGGFLTYSCDNCGWEINFSREESPIEKEIIAKCKECKNNTFSEGNKRCPHCKSMNYILSIDNIAYFD